MTADGEPDILYRMPSGRVVTRAALCREAREAVVAAGGYLALDEAGGEEGLARLINSAISDAIFAGALLPFARPMPPVPSRMERWRALMNQIAPALLWAENPPAQRPQEETESP